MASADQHVHQIKTEIELRMQSKICAEDNDVDTRFITLDLLREIWPSDNNRLKLFLPHEDHGLERASNVRNTLIRVLSTIIFVRPKLDLVRHALASFRARGYTDDALPLELGKLEELFDSIDAPQIRCARDFYEDQFLFKPIEIKEDDYTTTTVPRQVYRSRWPFVSIGEIGEGSSGVVSVAKVPAGSIQLSPKSRHLVDDGQRELIAFKKFKYIGDGQREVRRLAYLKNSHIHHAHITMHLTAILHGDDFYLFLPYTPLGDLATFLGEGTQTTYRERDGTSYTMREDLYVHADLFHGLSTSSLFIELGNLASALGFLHGGPEDNGSPIFCVHRDLRPANILVFPGDSTRNPVGQWKISDFGISSFTVDPEQENLRVGTVGDFVRHMTKASVIRVPAENEYRAPELSKRVNSNPEPTMESDIYSFGVVASDVLAFAFGRNRGRSGSLELESARDQRTTAYQSHLSPTTVTSPELWEFRTDAPIAQLKTGYLEWLRDVSRCEMPDAQMFRTCIAIILQAVKPNPRERASAKWLSRHLTKIRDDPLQVPDTSQPFDLDSYLQNVVSRDDGHRVGSQVSAHEEQRQSRLISPDVPQVAIMVMAEPPDRHNGVESRFALHKLVGFDILTGLVVGDKETLPTAPVNGVSNWKSRTQKALRKVKLYTSEKTEVSKVLAFAVSPDGQNAAFVVDENEHLVLEAVDVPSRSTEVALDTERLTRPQQKIKLPKDQQWSNLEVRMHGDFITVAGDHGPKKASVRQFLLHSTKEMISLASVDGIKGISDILPSKSGVFAFWGLQRLFIWNSMSTSKVMTNFFTGGDDDTISSVAFSADGDSLFLWSRRSLRIWSLKTKGPPVIRSLDPQLGRAEGDILLPCGGTSACLFQPRFWRKMLSGKRPPGEGWPCSADERWLVYVQRSSGKGLEICVVPLGSKDLLSEPVHLDVKIRVFRVSIENDRIATALRQESRPGGVGRWAVLVNAKREVQYQHLDTG